MCGALGARRRSLRDMLRQRLRRLLPATSKFVRDPNLRRVLGALLDDASLWHLNRASVATAVSVGLFMAWVPVPWQMILAGVAAALIGCNLPIAVAMVWVSNPITMPPLFYAAYKLGAWVLSIEPREMEFQLSLDWLLGELGAIWQPFLLGCFIMGVACAVLGNLAVRAIWRIHVIYMWRERRSRRKALESGAAPPTAIIPEAEKANPDERDRKP